MSIKKFNYQEKIRIIKGCWKGFIGKVVGYDNQEYKIKFSGRGLVTTYVYFRSHKMSKL